MRHILGLAALTPEQQERGDVTGDKKLSALDAATILQYITGLIRHFPALQDNLVGQK